MNALLDTCTFLWLALESGSTLLSPDTPLSLLGAARIW
jgi:hypothetical protein